MFHFQYINSLLKRYLGPINNSWKIASERAKNGSQWLSADKHNWDLWHPNANLGKMSRFWLILSTAYLEIIEKKLDCSNTQHRHWLGRDNISFSPEGNFLAALTGVLDMVSHVKQPACRNKHFRNPFRLWHLFWQMPRDVFRFTYFYYVWEGVRVGKYHKMN